MPILTPTAARTRLDTHLSDADLTTLIAEIEAEVAQVSGVPTYDADVTELALPEGSNLYLRAPIESLTSVQEWTTLTASALTLTENTDFAVWPSQGRIERIGGSWGVKAQVVYRPVDDTEKRKGVVVDLMRLILTTTALSSEQVGREYSYQRPDNWELERRRIVRRLMFPVL